MDYNIEGKEKQLIGQMLTTDIEPDKSEFLKELKKLMIVHNIQSVNVDLGFLRISGIKL